MLSSGVPGHIINAYQLSFYESLPLRCMGIVAVFVGHNSARRRACSLELLREEVHHEGGAFFADSEVASF